MGCTAANNVRDESAADATNDAAADDAANAGWSSSMPQGGGDDETDAGHSTTFQGRRGGVLSAGDRVGGGHGAEERQSSGSLSTQSEIERRECICPNGQRRLRAVKYANRAGAEGDAGADGTDAEAAAGHDATAASTDGADASTDDRDRAGQRSHSA